MVIFFHFQDDLCFQLYVMHCRNMSVSRSMDFQSAYFTLNSFGFHCHVPVTKEEHNKVTFLQNLMLTGS